LKVENLTVTVIATGNGLRLQWNASNASDWGFYYIMWGIIQGGPYLEGNWTISDDINHTYYNVTGLDDGVTYYFVVAAVDWVFNWGNWSDEASGIPQDTVAPALPTGLSVEYRTAANTLYLSWDWHTEDDVAGYHIWRSNTSGGNYTYVTTILGRWNNSYEDPALKNDTYYYVITAFDEVPYNSTYSNKAFGIVPDKLPPAPPTNLSIVVIPTGNALNISWDSVILNTDGSVCTDLAYYKLYRSIDENGTIFIPVLGGEEIPVGTDYFLDYNPPLVDNRTYYYYLVAVDNAPDPNVSPPSAFVSGVPQDTVAPEVPTGLTGTPQQPNRIVLTWDLNTVDNDIEGYTIWLNTTSGYVWVEDVLHPQSSHTLKGLEEGTYYFVISSYDEVPNNSTLSGEIMVILVDLNPPAHVENFTAVVIATGNALNLTWDPVTKNQDGTDCIDLVEYWIDRKNETGTYVRIANVSAGKEYYVDYGLENGIIYYYRIQAVDDASNPSLPSYTDGIPEDLSPPAPPSFVVVTAPPQGWSLVVTWKPSPDADVVEYNIYRSTDTVNWKKVDTKDASWTTSTDLEVTNGILYYYRVTAVDDDGKESVPSSGSGAVPVDRIAPSPPSWIAVDSIKVGNALIIYWEALGGNLGGDVVGYYLYRATEENGLYNRLTMNPIPADTTEFHDNGLVDGQTYYYRVTAVDNVPNESPASEIGIGIPMDEVAPNAPTGLTATALPEGNTIDLTWNPNTESDLEGYSIHKGDKPFELNWIADVDSGTVSFTDSGVTDGTMYYYQILAFDEVPNLSDFSSQTNAMAMDTIPPAPPTGLTIEVITTGNSLQLSWNANTESDLVNYSIYRSVDGINFFLVTNVSGGTESYIDTGLTDGIEYFYKILAADEVPNPSEFSEVVSETPQDTTPPSRPEGLTVVSTQESGSLMLLWLTNTEDDVAGYRVYRSTDNINYEFIWELAGVKSTTYTDYGLIAEMLYSYRITAFDEVPNESPYSDTMSYVPHTIPQTPDGLTVTSLPDGKALNISWTGIADPDVAFYKIYRSTDDRNYELIASIPQGMESYVDTDLENGRMYYYRITSSTKARVYIDFQPTNYWYYVESSESTSVGGVPYDSTLPGVPTGLKAASIYDGIYLSWEPLDEEGTVLYNIYRYLSPDSTPTLIASNVQGTSFIDTPSSMGQRYYYAITAVDESEQESQLSNQASAIWDVLVTDEEIGGRPLVEWNLIFIMFLIVLILIGAVFVWMRKRSEREEELYANVRELVKEEEDKIHEGPYSRAGIGDTPGVVPPPPTEVETVTEEEPPPPSLETLGDKISELEKKLKDIELVARLKSLEAIRGIGEAKTSANIAKETKTKIENKKRYIALKVDTYIRHGMFPSSMRGRLNELMTGFTTPQLKQFEGIVKSKAGPNMNGSALAVGKDEEIEKSEESLAELEEKLKEAEAEAKDKSKNALNAISDAKEKAKEAEVIRAELAELTEMVESKIDTCIRLGMFSSDSKEELTALLMGFTPEQLEQFGNAAKAGPGVKVPSEDNLCSSCGSPLEYKSDKGEWYCEACAKYQKPEKLEDKPPEPEPKVEDEFDEDDLPPPEDEDEIGPERDNEIKDKTEGEDVEEDDLSNPKDDEENDVVEVEEEK
jgi:fibronectin type 3 domain-containing protein